jgi:hypothetical protein
MVLTQLHTTHRTVFNGRRVPGTRETRGNLLGGGWFASHESQRPLLGKIDDGIAAAYLGEVPQGGDSKVITTASITGLTAGFSECENLTWAPTALLGFRPIRSPILGTHQAGIEQGVQGATKRCRTHGQPLAELGHRGWTCGKQAARNALSCLTREFHNTIVA